MKATEVRIRKALDLGESYVDPSFLLVETLAAPDGDSDGVTTIELVSCRLVNGRERWHIATLGQSVPLDHAGALEWAVSFAASRDIPVVYERDELSQLGYAAAAQGLEAACASSASK
jgi:hypothetical protein